MKKSNDTIRRNALRLASAFKTADQARLVFDPLFERLLSILMAEATKSARSIPLKTGEVARLSGRQRDVLQLVVRGHSNKIIAKHLGISEASVKIHVQAMLVRLGVCNRTEAAAVGAVSFLQSSISVDMEKLNGPTVTH